MTTTTTRLAQLQALRDRIDTEIRRELAYEKRRGALVKDMRRAFTAEHGGTTTRDGWSRHLIAATASHTRVTPEEIMGRSRVQHVAQARKVAMWLLRDAGRTHVEIGAVMGRDHSTVVHAMRSLNDDPELLEVALAVKAALLEEETAA